jgi:hypothetical protein
MADLEAKFEAGRSYLVRGSTLNDIIRELRLSRVVPGRGLREVAGPTGRVLHVIPEDTVIAPPFYPTLFEEDGTWKAVLQPGYLEWQNIGGQALHGKVMDFMIPTVSGTSIEADPRPEISIPLTCYCYLKVDTTARGVPVPDSAEIIVSSSAQTSVHHRPENGAASTPREGIYYWLLFQTASDGGSPARPVLVRTLPGNKQLPNQLIAFDQIGGEVEIIKGYKEEEDIFEVRTLKPLEGGAGGVSVLQNLDPPEDTVNFKWIAGNGYSSPIKVNGSGDDGIIVKGNSVSANFTWLDCDDMPVITLQVEDGMATVATGGEAILGDCGGGTGDPETTETPP